MWRVRRGTPWTVVASNRPLRDAGAIKRIRYWAEAQADGFDMLARTRQRHDPVRAWLYWRVLQIWRLHFNGTMSYSGGPCPRFLAAVLVAVDDEPTSPATIRNIIRRERAHLP